MRRWMLALVAGAGALAAGCGGDSKSGPKPPPDVNLKPLASPGAPGDAPPAKGTKGPGGAAAAQ